METDICQSPKAKRGQHDYRPMVPFGDPNAKPESLSCRNCGKTIELKTDEPEFPGIERD